MRRPFSPRLTALIAGDAAFVAAAVELVASLHGTAAAEFLSRSNLQPFGFTIAVCILVFSYTGLYESYRSAGHRDLYVRSFRAFGWIAMLLLPLHVWRPGAVMPGRTLAFAAPCGLAFFIGWRVAFEWLSLRIAPAKRWLLVGTSPGSISLARELHARKAIVGVEIVGFIDPDPSRVGEPLFNPRIIGIPEDIPRIVRERRIDRVIVSLPDARGQLPMPKLVDMRLRGVAFSHLATIYEEFTGKIAIENLRPSWLLFSSGFDASVLTFRLKRLADVAVAVIGLVTLAPLLAALALAVRLTSRGRVLYRQRRVGLNGIDFTLVKFRSMTEDAETKTGAVWARENDERLTCIGGVLRRYRLDELPQLWNVLKGDMSLVGPRPERPLFVDELSRQISFYGQRHVVRPGLTGWAQVCYHYGASVSDAVMKLQYDLFYIKNLSLWLDLLIMISTIKTVLTKRGT